jgi:hypothetical protein
MRTKALWVTLLVIAMAGSAAAQEIGAGAGRVEIGAFPGGGMFFTQSNDGNAPDFGNYALGGTFAYNVNRWVGVEGDGGGSLGVHQEFRLGQTQFRDQRSPNTWMYSGNVVLNALGSDRAVVPYATGGLGGLTLCPCAGGKDLGIDNYETYFTGNVGGGVKWFSTHHVGVRADYRFFMVRNRDNAPLFFGTGTRHGHRVQAGLIFTY